MSTQTVTWTFSQPIDRAFWYATATVAGDASGFAGKWDAADAFKAANPGAKVRSVARDSGTRRGAGSSVAVFRVYA